MKYPIATLTAMACCAFLAGPAVARKTSSPSTAHAAHVHAAHLHAAHLHAAHLHAAHLRAKAHSLLTGHSIWIDKARQRLYAFNGKKLILEAKCSTAAHHEEYAKGDHRLEPVVTPTGRYHIIKLDPDYWSHTYKVHMLDAMFFDSGRAIHATYPSEYARLGLPASAGCVRLTRGRARALYHWVHKGDVVHVVHQLPRQVARLVHLSPNASPLLHKKA